MSKQAIDTEVSARIRKLRAGSTYAQFSEHIGFKNAASYIHDLEHGKKAPSLRFLLAVSKTLNVNLNWLLEGSGSSFRDREDPDSAPVRNLKEMVQISFIDLPASAGHGEITEDNETIQKWLISSSLLGEIFELNSPSGSRLKENYKLIRIRGSSMEPQIKDGAVCLVDTLDRKPVSGKVYVISLDHQLYVKQILIDKTQEKILAHSFNPSYEDLILHSKDSLLPHKIIARVISSTYSRSLF